MIKLETDRLILREFLPTDWEDLYEYLSLPEVVEYEPYGIQSQEDCIDEAKYRASQGSDNSFFAVCLKENNKVIGQIYFSQEGPKEFRTFEIGYVFNPKFYHKGYATEASKRILEYGFKEKNAHRITAGVNVKNEASWKLLERLSMRREAYMQKNVFFKKDSSGEPIWNDSYQYGILSTEF